MIEKILKYKLLTLFVLIAGLPFVLGFLYAFVAIPFLMGYHYADLALRSLNIKTPKNIGGQNVI
jgi:hypothetical protein